MTKLEQLQEAGEAPDWLTPSGLLTLSQGYLIPGETPKDMWIRVSKSAAKYLDKPELAQKFFDYIWNNWLCLSTPVAANAGTARGLPISCYGISVSDSLDSIFKSYHESAMLIKNGGGVGKLWKIRDRGTGISGNGVSDGIIPWLKLEEQTLQSTAQGGVRRGSGASYLNIRSNEITDFLDIRKPTGDPSRRVWGNSFHHAVVIDDEFMNAAKKGSKYEREIWEKLLTTRIETGEPYIMFKDNANKDLPNSYKERGFKVETSQLCSEIFLYCDSEHTYVCCLSSVNLSRYDEWKDTDLVQTSIWFLDGIMSEFIEKAKSKPGFTKAVRFAEKSRALGLGVVGWHTYLQSKMLPFEAFGAMQDNALIFKNIREEADKATKDLAKEYGEPEWCKGHGVRNTHLIALAPTTSNALISGGVSQGIEPLVANIYAQKSAKGTFIRKNPQLQKLLQSMNKDTIEVWDQINMNYGSVKTLSFLSDLEKEVFATAVEINQFAIVRQAAQRQIYIDQGQSLNLFFSSASDEESKKKLGKYMHKVHFLAWELGLKSLYYLRTNSVTKGDSVFREESSCRGCEA